MKRIFFFFTITVAFALAVPSASAAPPQLASVMSPLLRQAPGLSPKVLSLALTALSNAESRGLVKRDDRLTVIDYSLPSSQPRLFVFDLASKRLLFRELCAHGRNSGDDHTSFFSNDPGSLATSLGLFVTEDTYIGNNGYSLRLRGLEAGFNDMAWDRAIVMHGAAYVSQAAIKMLGRLGRSWGCPAVPKAVAQRIIDTIRGGSAVFAYYPEKDWLDSSTFLR
jgi:hypothetical protein